MHSVITSGSLSVLTSRAMIFCVPRYTLYRDIRYTELYVIPSYTLYRDIRYTELYVIPSYTLYRAIRYTELYVIPRYTLYRDIRYTELYVIPSYTVNQYRAFDRSLLTCVCIGLVLLFCLLLTPITIYSRSILLSVTIL